MTTLSQVKKQINSEFKKVTVKRETSDGRSICLRDNDGKLIKMISTKVQLSPMDCTNVKSEKIKNSFDQVCNVVKSLGGVLDLEVTSTFNIYKFDKGFTVKVSVEKFVSTTYLDEGYKDVYINVSYE